METKETVKPIIFSSESIRAILEDKKTQTRRVIKDAMSNWIFDSLCDNACMMAIDKHGEEYPKDVDGLWATFEAANYDIEFPMIKSRYEVGDVLYVKEIWECMPPDPDSKEWGFMYSDGSTRYIEMPDTFTPMLYSPARWRSPIYMPRTAARIFLRVTDIRVEKLQQISEEDAKAEGANFKNGQNVGWEEKMKRSSIDRFRKIWDSINGKKLGCSWEDNPWVWVITFERVNLEMKERESE